MNVITVNTGSSSVRLSRFRVEGDQREREADLHLELAQARPEPSFERLLAGTPDLVAHRVVHGGERLVAPTMIDQAVENEIERLAPLAPLHNPLALRWIRSARDRFGPLVPQVAVFDTAFFAQLPAAAATYAIPLPLARRLGLRRFGFHGLAHRAMWRAFRDARPDLPEGGRIVTLQLGSGSSAAAIDRGRPLDTSMGFSPLEGLVMASRPGDLDAGLVLYLLRECGLSADELDRILSHESGLLGLGVPGGDLRNADPASLAVEIYCHRARKYIGAYLALLGGADGIVFGGGVGEHRPDVRARILSGLEWARVGDIRVVAVDEAAVILDEALSALASPGD